MKRVSMIVSMLVVMGVLLYCVHPMASRKVSAESPKNPIATLVLEDEQIIKIELYVQYAPNTVNNFIDLASKKFYDGMAFSKIIPDYLLQTGDPIGDGTGFPGYFIKSECKHNGFKNKLKCEEGTVCMARGKKFNTEGSQFFILLQDDASLNGQYAAFGKVVEGLELLKKIGKAEVDEDYVPKQKVQIERITIETFGQNYAEPEVLSIFEKRKDK